MELVALQLIHANMVTAVNKTLALNNVASINNVEPEKVQ